MRRDQEREEKLRQLQAAIDEGRASGIGGRDPFEYLDALRGQVRDIAGKADAA